MAKITTDDYLCICYFKQRINWRLVFAHWSQGKRVIVILEQTSEAHQTEGIKTVYCKA